LRFGAKSIQSLLATTSHGTHLRIAPDFAIIVLRPLAALRAARSKLLDTPAADMSQINIRGSTIWL
jgi:hypothetical protein